MKRLLGGGLVLAGVLYPFAVHYGLAHVPPRQFGIVLGLLWLARACWLPGPPGDRSLNLVVLAFCIFVAVSDSAALLHWYPVLLNAVFLGVFASSLRGGPSLVERLARLREPQLSPAAVRYTRRVTQAWCLFFLLNGSIAAALTLWGPSSWWALYNGCIAYLAMGLLFAAEWLIRQRVRGRP